MLCLQFTPEPSESRTVPGPCYQNLVIDQLFIWCTGVDTREKRRANCRSLTDTELVMACLSLVSLMIPCGPMRDVRLRDIK